jgi:hypothetical protein
MIHFLVRSLVRSYTASIYLHHCTVLEVQEIFFHSFADSIITITTLLSLSPDLRLTLRRGAPSGHLLLFAKKTLAAHSLLVRCDDKASIVGQLPTYLPPPPHIIIIMTTFFHYSHTVGFIASNEPPSCILYTDCNEDLN